jgi:O-antigen/teichoic acid export membrane protein
VAVILLVAVVFSEPLLRFLYGDTYLEVAGGMRLMALFYGLVYSYWPIQSALKALGRPKPMFVGSLAALAAMATVGVAAILRWGVFGTIAGQALSAAIMALVVWATWLRWLRSTEAKSVTGQASVGEAG